MASEKTALLKKRGSRFGPDIETPGANTSGGTFTDVVVRPDLRKSLVDRSNEADAAASFSKVKKKKSRSYSINSTGEIINMSPVEMGRQELYDNIPYTAVFGLQTKERSLSAAYANFAAELDVIEADAYAVKTTGKGLSDEEKTKRKLRSSQVMVEELEADTVTITSPLIFAVIGASIAQFNNGYNIGNMNAIEPFVFPGHSTTSWALAVSAFCIGGPFGAVFGGSLADKNGRRSALMAVTWLYLVGGIVMALAGSMNFIIAGRFIIGFAGGASSVVVPVFLGELAPPTLRGVLGTLTQFSLVVGILAADIVTFPLLSESGWRWMFSITSLLACCELAIANWLLESPRWILGKNPDSGKARFIIKVLRGYRFDHQVEGEVEHFLGAQKNQLPEGDKGNQTLSKNATLEMLSDKNVNFLAFSAIFLNMAQQLCGINAVFYYSGMFFEGVIDNPLVGTTIVAAVNVIATYVALLLMDSMGRRTLLMWSAGGMGLCCVAVVAALLGYLNKVMALVAVGAYVSFFEIGLGPIPFLIIPEMFDAKYVTTAMSISSQINWTCNFIVGLGFPYVNNALGPYSFGPFAVVLLLTFLFALFFLPETAGTSPEELQKMLAKKNEGTTYHNMDIQKVSQEDDLGAWDDAMEELAKEMNASPPV